MSEDPKKEKPAPKPEPKPQQTPSSQFAEVRAGNAPKTKADDGRRWILGKDGKRTGEFRKPRIISRTDAFGKKEYAPGHHPPKKTSSPRKSRGGGGSGALTPLPPYTRRPYPKMFPNPGGQHDPSMYGFRNAKNEGLRIMHKKNADIAQEKYNKLIMTPQGKYRRQLWDMKMAEVGLNPQGDQLGGLRQIMIQRMNQLRGGR